MENIKLVIELILVAQFISAVAIVFLFQRLKFFLDHYNTSMKNMADFVNKLSDDIVKEVDTATVVNNKFYVNKEV